MKSGVTAPGSLRGVYKTWARPWPGPWPTLWPALWPTLWPTQNFAVFTKIARSGKFRQARYGAGGRLRTSRNRILCYREM